MCDTLGFTTKDGVIFAKNSDRSPNEPQVLEFVPAAEHKDGEIIKATYISVPQIRKTHAVLLSRPVWLWGAEIGINDCGVCIGNEAVWTLGSYGKTGLTGMDMLRLALERSGSALEAVKILADMLEKYGQGGNCGFDHAFFYDNSFLAADKNNIYVLETAGREWVYKKYDKVSISNRLSIGSDGDVYSSDRCNFSLKHTEHIYNIASASSNRKKMTSCAVNSAATVVDAMAAMRQHRARSTPFATGSVGSTCMHFGGLVGDHTTASFIADLQGEIPVIWATGCSSPCVSLYKPCIFGGEENTAMRQGEGYWRRLENFTRNLIGKEIPGEYFAERDFIEQGWIKEAANGNEDIFTTCFDTEKTFLDKWSRYSFKEAKTTAAFDKRWAKKNEVL